MARNNSSTDTKSGLGGRIAVRLLVAILPIAILVLAVRTTGLIELVDVEQVRALVQRAGIWRVPLFVMLYGLGILAHVPGSVFVGAGVLAFGPGWGLVWCYLGALLGNLLSFGIVRLAGYRPLATRSWPMLERLFLRLVQRPTRSVTAIRIIFPTTAPVNYALALTDIAFPPYLVGSLVGVLPQLVACVWLFAFVFE